MQSSLQKIDIPVPASNPHHCSMHEYKERDSQAICALTPRLPTFCVLPLRVTISLVWSKSYLLFWVISLPRK